MTAWRPTRRAVLRAGAITAAVAATTGIDANSTPGGDVMELHVNEGFVPMVDGSLVYQRGFGDRPTPLGDPSPSLTCAPRAFLADGRVVDGRAYPPGAPVPPEGRPSPAGPDPAAPGNYLVHTGTWASLYPRRTILAEEGATVRLRVVNHLQQEHSLSVQDVPSAQVSVPPGQSRELVFTAPAPGTYIWSDGLRAPVERVLGLHGVLLVVPTQDRWRVAAGSVPFERQWLWICHDVDPSWGQLALDGRVVDPVAQPAVPRYFTLNDRSGYASLGVTTDEAANTRAHEDALPSGWPRRTSVRDPEAPGRAGQVLRLVNTGVAVHQLHFHGNHVWSFRRQNVELSRSQAVLDGLGRVDVQQWEDVIELDPMARADIVLPVKRPPDVVPAVWESRDGDWHYPMHCHAEMSQTAGGGAYPGGLVGGWVLAGGTPDQGGT